MEGKIVIVSGASSGIGKITARELAKMGAKVTLACRDEGRGQAAIEAIRAEVPSASLELLLVDFASQSSIREAAAKFKASHDRLDVLVNNAGAVLGERSLTAEGIEATFATNHLGYFLFTHELLPLLEKSAPARIVNVASDAHKAGTIDFDNLRGEKSGYSSFGTYCASKLANILFTSELARRLEGKGVTVNCCHPGVVASNFGQSGTGLMRFFYKIGSPFMTTEEKGARTQIWLASSPDVEGQTGKYFIKEREKSPSSSARDVDLQKKLWSVSEAMTNATY